MSGCMSPKSAASALSLGNVTKGTVCQIPPVPFTWQAWYCEASNMCEVCSVRCAV